MANTASYKLKRIFLCYVPVVIWVILTVFPYYWFINISLTANEMVMKLPVYYYPKYFSLNNYIKMFTVMDFGQYFKNSIIVAGGTTIVITLLAIFGGYALSRYNFRGKGGIMLLLLITQMFPGIILLIPLFSIFVKLGIYDSLTSLILVNATTNLPFCMIMCCGFYATVPPTLEEAAMIDGCSTVKALFRVVLPAILPGIVTCGAFAFVNAWNEFVFSLNFISTSSKFTIPVGLSMMQGEYTVNYGGIAAGTIVALAPVLLIFCYIQKYLVGGLTAGAVKG